MSIQAPLLLAVVFVCLPTTSLCQEANENLDQDWPRFLGATSEAIVQQVDLQPWPNNGLRKLWEAEFGYSYSPPAVSNGLVYHFDRIGLENRVRCRNSKTGTLLWEKVYETDFEAALGYGNGPRSSPVVDEERLYTYGPEGKLQCRATGNGRLVWEVDTTKDYGVVANAFGVVSTPWVEDELIITMVGGSEPRANATYQNAVGNGTGLVAFDKKNGKEIYRLSNELASYSSPVVRDVRGKRIGFATMRGGLVIFDPKNGTELSFYPWQARFAESAHIALPIVYDNEVFLTETYGSGSTVVRIETLDSRPVEIWNAKKSRSLGLRCHFNTPIRLGKYVFGCSGRHSNNAELRCVSWETGEIMWAEKRIGRCALTLIGNKFIGVSEDGEVFMFRAIHQSFQKIASFKDTGIAHPCWNAPVVVGKQIFLTSKDKLICYALPHDNMEQTASPTPNETLEAPVYPGEERIPLIGQKDVTKLDLSFRNVTDKDLKTLRVLATLEELNLFDNKISDIGLKSLVGIRIKSLNLGRNRITDQATTVLSAMHSLESIDLRECEISDDGLDALIRLPKLSKLGLRKTNITDTGIEKLTRLKALRSLNLYSTSISDKGVQSLAKRPNITELNLNGTAITGKSFASLAENQSLRKLSVQYIYDFTLSDFEHFRNHRGLEELSLYDTPVTDGFVDVIISMSSLKKVDLRLTDISEAGITKLLEANKKIKVQH